MRISATAFAAGEYSAGGAVKLYEAHMTNEATVTRVTLENGDVGGTYLLVSSDGRDILVQTDWDYPGVATNLGWSPRIVHQAHCHVKAHDADGYSETCDGEGCAYDSECPDCCEHDGTDGTVTCDCGVSASDFIASAAAWLDDHMGESFDDPGYFNSDE